MGITVEIGGRHVLYIKVNWMLGYGWGKSVSDGICHLYFGKLHIAYGR